MHIDKFTDTEFREWLSVYLIEGYLYSDANLLLLNVCKDRLTESHVIEVGRLFFCHQRKIAKIRNSLCERLRSNHYDQSTAIHEMTIRSISDLAGKLSVVFFRGIEKHMSMVSMGTK